MNYAKVSNSTVDPGTTHAVLIAEILGLSARQTPAAPPTRSQPLSEPMSDSELRVLRYLPTNLTRREIAAELYVSLNTVSTHMRNVYAKLGTHRRAESLARARALGLLAPSARSADPPKADLDLARGAGRIDRLGC